MVELPLAKVGGSVAAGRRWRVPGGKFLGEEAWLAKRWVVGDDLVK